MNSIIPLRTLGDVKDETRPNQTSEHLFPKEEGKNKKNHKSCLFFEKYVEATAQWRRSERIPAKALVSLPLETNNETAHGLQLDSEGVNFPVLICYIRLRPFTIA